MRFLTIKAENVSKVTDGDAVILDGKPYIKTDGEFVEYNGNYITAIGKRAVAVKDGVEVPMPEVLYNENKVPYVFVDYYEHGKKMAKKHGIFLAQKQDFVRVYRNLTGHILEITIQGAMEHKVVVKPGEVVIHNIARGDSPYPQKESYLEENYNFVRHDEGFDVYQPKAGNTTQWTYSNVNVFGVLWESLEFLTTPMINLTNPEDCYGCNYIVFWGDDKRVGSYRLVGFISPTEVRYFPGENGEPVSVVESTFQPPKYMF